ncbi:hypothetical protein [Candidatus Nitrospira salsa]
MTSVPQDTGNCFFRGTYLGAKALEDGEKNARQHAYRQVAQFLNSDEDEMHCTPDRAVTSVVDHTLSPLSIPATVIQKVKVIDTYYKVMTRVDEHSTLQKFDVSVLVSYSKKEAVLEQERQQEVILSKIVNVCNILKGGKVEQKNGENYHAVLSAVKALELLAKIQGISPIVQRDVVDCQKLELQLRTLKKESIESLKRVGFWIQESSIKGNLKTSLLTTSLKSILEKHAFTILNSSTPKGLSALPLFSLAWQGDTKALKLFHRQGIHTLIVGQASTTFHSTAMEQHFFDAQGELRVFETSSGGMITSIPINARAYHRDKSEASHHSLTRAGQEAGELLVEKFLFEDH